MKELANSGLYILTPFTFANSVPIRLQCPQEHNCVCAAVKPDIVTTISVCNGYILSPSRLDDVVKANMEHIFKLTHDGTVYYCCYS